MTEDRDRESQTEEPTEKKLNDAIASGSVPISHEASLLSSLAAILIVMIYILPNAVSSLISALVYFIDDPSAWRLERSNDVVAILKIVLLDSGVFLVAVLSPIVIQGLATSMAQNAPQFVVERIRPQISRISIAAGLNRLIGIRGWTQFLKNIFKVVMVGGIACAVLSVEKISLVESIVLDVGGIPSRLLGFAVSLASAVVAAILVVASIDLVWVRIHWRRDQRMSHQEIKEEIKQSEGDRVLKARLRSIRLDRLRKRMLTAVPKATLVVVNPTHYAVALRYIRGQDVAPLVVAKGLDLIALKIREIAEQNNVPIIEDRPLARSLYDAVNVDATIPSEFYRAIAELIHLIHQKELLKSSTIKRSPK